jgi:hypothetical protein
MRADRLLPTKKNTESKVLEMQCKQCQLQTPPQNAQYSAQVITNRHFPKQHVLLMRKRLFWHQVCLKLDEK